MRMMESLKNRLEVYEEMARGLSKDNVFKTEYEVKAKELRYIIEKLETERGIK